MALDLSNYKLVKGESDWQDKYNKFIDDFRQALSNVSDISDWQQAVMSGNTKVVVKGDSNLLIGTGTTVNSDTYPVVKYATTEPLVLGNTYTISVYVEELECEGVTNPRLDIYDGAGWLSQAFLMGDTPGMMHTTFTYRNEDPDHFDPNHILIVNTFPESDAKRKAVLHHVMLVKGDTPAAWAPAEGEGQ